ncbi:hypothetical protein OsI_02064 [Oryza sativa Indica Group]|uniref:Uncharacterized protein n=1 Tax=Oryza sativa subsp. indica TaxID=39946 RepID=B8A8K4_ORYSI|nr:hypothetical protein OsI_02064 [Oryza sativa Indica Group]
MALDAKKEPLKPWSTFPIRVRGLHPCSTWQASSCACEHVGNTRNNGQSNAALAAILDQLKKMEITLGEHTATITRLESNKATTDRKAKGIYSHPGGGHNDGSSDGKGLNS